MYHSLTNTRFKKIFFILLIVSLIPVLCATDAIGKSRNLVRNGSFEESGDWRYKTDQAPKLERVEESSGIEAKDGDYFRIGQQDEKDSDSRIWQYIYLGGAYGRLVDTGNVTVTLTAYTMREPGQDDTTKLGLAFLDEEEEVLSDGFSQEFYYEDWEQVSFDKKVPKGTKIIKVILEVIISGDGNADGAFDDVELRLDIPKIDLTSDSDNLTDGSDDEAFDEEWFDAGEFLEEFEDNFPDADDYNDTDEYLEDVNDFCEFSEFVMLQFKEDDDLFFEFEDLYFDADGNRAESFNNDGDEEIRQFTIENTGDSETLLKWELVLTTAAKKWIELDVESGELQVGDTQTITMTLKPMLSEFDAYNPGSSTRLGGSIRIKTNAIKPEEGPWFSFKYEYDEHGDHYDIASLVRRIPVIWVHADAYFVATDVAFTKPARINDVVYVAPQRSVEFEATPPGDVNLLFPGVSEVSGYEWQYQSTGVEPESQKYEKTTTNNKWFTFSDLGDYTVYCRVVDGNDVADAVPVQIEVSCREAPEVDTTGTGASWLDNRYVGEMGQPVHLNASGDPVDEDSSITNFIWDLNGDDEFGGDGEQQSPGASLERTFTTPTFNTQIKCKAVSDKDLESEPQAFELKIYESVVLDSGGPYTGRAQTPVKLKGSINMASYPGADINYTWKVSGESLEDENGQAEYSWPQDSPPGEPYTATLEAQVETAEGLELSGSVDTTVVIDSGKPTAMPGDSYRGGIIGGNFSPVQFQGNHPDFVEDEPIGKIAEWEWTFQGGSISSSGIWNPTVGYSAPGTYTPTLTVTSEFGKSSDPKETNVTIIVGKIHGIVRAADLRTPVKEATMTLSSSHVDKTVLAAIAAADDTLNVDGDGNIWTLTDDYGYYTFAELPLGSYQVTASKENGLEHEFETNPRGVELTLDTPESLAHDFVDVSVFPVGGQITYNVETAKDGVYVAGVIVKAYPVGSVSFVESPESTRTLLSGTSKNYSLPLFSGKYLLYAQLGGHDIRMDTDVLGYEPIDSDEPDSGGLITIEEARSDVDFIDYTTRKVTIYVEDSGGYPIDTYQDNAILGQVNGTYGFDEGEVVIEEGVAYFETLVPPGQYTVKLPNVPSAVVKNDKSKREAELDLEATDGSVTMVVPVPIELEFAAEPTLFPDSLPDDFFDYIGIDREDNPEGFMAFNPDDPQTHTYEITATANGYVVPNFTLKVTDSVRRVDYAPAGQITYPGPPDGRFEEEGTGEDYRANYTVVAGIPNMTVVNESDPSTYVEVTLPDGSTVKVPQVRPKTIAFQASKDGYDDSAIVTKEITVLGDVPASSGADLISVPNVNYLVLHDPPGDGSYSYINDTITVKGIISGMKIKNDLGHEVPVYPSPWSEERRIDDVDFGDIMDGDQNLGDDGILQPRNPTGAVGGFYIGLAYETGIGTATAFLGLGGLAFATQLVNIGLKTAMLSSDEGYSGIGIVQHEITRERGLETPSDDDFPDIMGPGRGDVYYGEGWTLALQNKFRLGITEGNPDATKIFDPNDPDNSQWVVDSYQIYAYAVLDRDNQYTYTVRDIVNIIADLEAQVAALDEPINENEEDEKEKLENAIDTWESLLDENPAYVWYRDHIKGSSASDREALEEFFESEFSDQNGELLIFSGGPSFEYSRTVGEGQISTWSTEAGIYSSGGISTALKVGSTSIWAGLGGGTETDVLEIKLDGQVVLESSNAFGVEFDSGMEVEQTVGFVLHDNDIGNNFSTYVFEGPWGTPVFFTDPASVTTAPWQPGTTKGVDIQLEMIGEENNGPFDYRDGAHYRFRVSNIGSADRLEGYGNDFIFYDLPLSNTKNAIVKFNGSDEAPYKMVLYKDFSTTELLSDEGSFDVADNIQPASAQIVVSIYPPTDDLDNVFAREYPVLVQAESAQDYQIAVNKLLRPKFGDLRSPRAIITTPYEGQRLSPAVFTGEEPFIIQVLTDDEDLARIQVELTSKQTSGVWYPWQILSGILWEDPNVPEYQGAENPNVTVVTHSERVPQRREFTFEWTGSEISNLGEGEYAVRAVGSDRATRLQEDGETQALDPNVDLDAITINFRVDGTKPTVLTTKPFYQNKESERVYIEELSVTFTDDMRATDFTDRTFYVTDLLDGGKQVAGFVSYSPSLRKAMFVPVVPFKPNTFYRTLIKTDTVNEEGELELGVHDLAGNPLDQEFSWTFRTKDSPFEELWSIILSATDGISTDGNNIAAVAFNGIEGEDEMDALAIPPLTAEPFRLVFMNQGIDYERDIRNADGRLSHHWFFVIENAASGSDVTVSWELPTNLTRDSRQYQSLQLVEFDKHGDVQNVIPMLPVDEDIGSYTYTSDDKEPYHYFRIDVGKASSLVAENFEKGKTGWKFFSAPITPQIAEPFINLGDDLDPFQLYQYDTQTSGYKIYPSERWEVALQAGHGYFTRLQNDVEVDVGGVLNLEDKELSLETPGWHAIGNPFLLAVEIKNLEFTQDNQTKNFNQAVNAGWIEDKLYWWETKDGGDQYRDVSSKKDELEPWEGYWLKGKVENLTMIIPAPPDVEDALPKTPESLLPPHAAPILTVPPMLSVDRNQGFELRLALTSNFASDVTTVLGTKPDAKGEYDVWDTSEPPMLSQTVSAYFDHQNWGDDSGRYNTDYQPVMKVGETRTWPLVMFTDKPDSKLLLSWADAIGQLPDDTMFHFRRVETDSEWQDMRTVHEVEVTADARVTKAMFEVRAMRFEMSPPTDVSVTASDGQVELRWAANTNLFISDYIIERESMENGERQRFEVVSGHRFVDRNVVEEMTYTYQVVVRFKTGAELKSEPLTVTVPLVIKRTVLLQNYPNPFNPETWLPYELKEENGVTIEIYSVSGELIRTLSLGVQNQGRYISKEKAAYWDGKTDFGERAASGLYFYVMRTGSFAATRRMVIMK